MYNRSVRIYRSGSSAKQRSIYKKAYYSSPSYSLHRARFAEYKSDPELSYVDRQTSMVAVTLALMAIAVFVFILMHS